MNIKNEKIEHHDQSFTNHLTCHCNDLSSTELKSMWSQFFFEARTHVKNNKWSHAIKLYQQALHISEHMLVLSNNHKTVINQFMMISVEIAYCFRNTYLNKNTDFSNSDYLNVIYFMLKEHISESQIKANIKPLMDILYSDLKNCKHWIDILFAMEEKQQYVLN
ncbi:hypothetical protein [Marinicellulosiphila megalodicopiae]|uniref:hypothetical protein n=1 Tax=Marinicellulosiphila megalodicopiae TaxID=2724896 RepID=UPI003BAF1515